MHAGLPRERRHRVAQIVQRIAATRARRIACSEHLERPPRVIRLADLVHEHIAGVGPRRSELEPLSPFMLSMRTEGEGESSVDIRGHSPESECSTAGLNRC